MFLKYIDFIFKPFRKLNREKEALRSRVKIIGFRVVGILKIRNRDVARDRRIIRLADPMNERTCHNESQNAC